MEGTTTNSLVPFQPFQLGQMKLRHTQGEGFEGSSVVRIARGKTCFLLPFCRQEAVRARQKTMTANLNSRDLMYRLGPAPKRGTRPIDQSAWRIVGKSQGVLLCPA